MHVSFTANSFFSDDDGDVVYGSLQAGNENQNHYLNFQRSLEPDDKDGIYLEHNGQENGGFNKIKSCQLSRKEVIIQLSGQLGFLQNVEEFDIFLDLDDDLFNEFRDFILRVFQGYEDILSMR